MHLFRRCYGDNNESDLGRESQNVHHNSGQSNRVSKSLAWVLNYHLHVVGAEFSYVDGLSSIYHQEGLKGWYRGTSLALVGVSNGAIQFMGYEKMKAWGFDQKRKRFAAQGRKYGPEDDKLVSPYHRYL